MRRVRLLIAVAGLGLGPVLLAQQPGPFPAPTAGEAYPAGFHHGAVAAPCTSKVCVTEMQPTKKVVHGSECKDYCHPRSCVADLFRSLCGLGCSDCNCGDVRTRRVLLKKSVPGPEKAVCVLKDPCAEQQKMLEDQQKKAAEQPKGPGGLPAAPPPPGAR